MLYKNANIVNFVYYGKTQIEKSTMIIIRFFFEIHKVDGIGIFVLIEFENKFEIVMSDIILIQCSLGKFVSEFI